MTLFFFSVYLVLFFFFNKEKYKRYMHVVCVLRSIYAMHIMHCTSFQFSDVVRKSVFILFVYQFYWIYLIGQKR